ncbi:MAG: Rpn family recombination-promoting nuclease/putative transposase [Magnetococcales bacterium]|nr:Rpn family recombination-promoting nuclease/putative transposase [Magnetococcales bacterium]
MTDHDSLYHRFFSHPAMVADLLRGFMEREILDELDLSRMSRVNTKFTAFRGARRRSDVIWEIPLRGGGHLFVLLLLEFQSTVDAWMSLRTLVYAGLLYQQLVDERKLKPDQGLPPLLPIVLYNGEPRWNAPIDIRALIRLPPGSPLWPFQPAMRYHTLDEGAYTEEELKGRPSLSALLFRLEQPANPQGIMETIRDMAEWFRAHPDGPPVKQLFRELIASSLQRIEGFVDLPPIPDDLLEVVNMLAARVEQWSKEIRQRGFQEGIQIGEQKGRQEGRQENRQEGRREGKADLLLRQLRQRFGPLLPEWVGEHVRAADAATIEVWGDRILTAHSLEEVFAEVTRPSQRPE